jgi:SNF2 family DNA or RNA helicase
MLQRLVRPFVLRRTKQQVLTELPPKIVDKRYCELTSEQRTLYRRVMESRAKPLRMQLRAGAVISYVHVFAALNFLKQICNHPASAGGGFAENATSGKWELFVELLDECMSSGLKVVVFSQYVKMLELIEQHLASRDLGFASIKGSTRARGGEIARFRDDDSCRVFTASLRAGGLGIDLTSASVVIHYDRWWNQAREDQATDRVHRLGQNKGVQVIKLITRGTVEEKIDELIARKARLATELIQTDDPALVKQFTVEELEELLGE